MAEIRTLSGWGRTAPSVASVLGVATAQDVIDALAAKRPRGAIARGMGRSYGDAAQNAGGTVLATARMDAVGPLDPSGEVTCAAGVTLDMLLRVLVPAGRFLPVTPGTRYVSLGGAIAADVHGKNQPKAGSFAHHVTRIELVDGLGRLRHLVPGDELFQATVGGMGLTGVISQVTIRTIPIASAWMVVDTIRTRDLDDTLNLLDASDGREHRVAWIDGMSGAGHAGRGVVTLADHAAPNQLDGAARTHPLRWHPRGRLSAPPWAPPRLLTSRRVAAFNEITYRRAPRRTGDRIISLDSCFYPLDRIRGWNRLYGRDGLVQYQFVSPSAETIEGALALLRRAHAPAFLAVLKKFGQRATGHLSFPMPGWTLAIDLPAEPDLGRCLDQLDELVTGDSGRVYLAKDSRLRPALLPKMYPRLSEWQVVREEADPGHVFQSDLGRRLGL